MLLNKELVDVTERDRVLHYFSILCYHRKNISWNQLFISNFQCFHESFFKNCVIFLPQFLQIFREINFFIVHKIDFTIFFHYRVILCLIPHAFSRKNPMCLLNKFTFPMENFVKSTEYQIKVHLFSRNIFQGRVELLFLHTACNQVPNLWFWFLCRFWTYIWVL